MALDFKRDEIISILFSLIALSKHNEDDPKSAQRASYIQHDYRKNRIHATVFSQTLYSKGKERIK